MQPTGNVYWIPNVRLILSTHFNGNFSASSQYLAS